MIKHNTMISKEIAIIDTKYFFNAMAITLPIGRLPFSMLDKLA
jgi:hypothetical protein